MALKDYKIVWFTEGGWQGKVSLDNPNMRNDVSTKYILGAEHYPIFQIPQVLQHFGEGYFDFAIVTLPKTKVDKLLQFEIQKVFVINTSGDYEFLEVTFEDIGVKR